MEDKLCISVAEFATQLGVSKPIAYEIVKRQNFPSITIGRRIIIPTEQLQHWLSENAGKAI